MIKKKQKTPSKGQLERENDKLKQENEELKKQVAELTRQLAGARTISPNFKKPKKLDEADVEKIKEYHADGQSKRQIAQELGVSEGTIRNYLKN